MPKIKCRTCDELFENWGKISAHMLEHAKIKNDPHKRDRAGILWAKRYKHKEAINKLKKIGQDKDAPFRPTLTDKQKQAKAETKYIPSGRMKEISIKCPRCGMGRKEEIEIEYYESPQALKQGECFLILCKGCR